MRVKPGLPVYPLLFLSILTVLGCSKEKLFEPDRADAGTTIGTDSNDDGGVADDVGDNGNGDSGNDDNNVGASDDGVSTYVPGRYVGTDNDPWIPNFAHSDIAAGPVIRTRQPGNWSDSATWGGVVPGPADVAVVEHAVVLGGDVEVLDLVIYPNGFLRFETDVSSQLNVGTLQVHVDGKLEIGRPSNPIANYADVEIVFANRDINTNVDPGQYGQGLLVFGEVTISGEPVVSNYVRLSREPKAGDTTLVTTESLEGWRAGGRLVLPDSRQTNPLSNNGFVSQTEAIDIANVSMANGVITLATPLIYKHSGARGTDGEIDLLPHAAWLSANVVLRSANANGVRGHTQFFHRAVVDIRHALFKDLGRTTATELNNTEFNEQGNATTIGTNQTGRFPVHFDHLIGPETPADNGFQYTFFGNSIDGGDDEHVYKSGIMVNASHYGQVSNNTVYNYAGAGFVTGDGSETGNVFDHNFVARCPVVGTIYARDRSVAGTAFWFRRQNNYMTRNVAADATSAGFSIRPSRIGEVKIPSEQGGPGRISVDMNTLPILSFSGNESYGPALHGLDLWDIGATRNTLHDIERSVINDLRIWHHNIRAIRIIRTHRTTFNRVVVRGDAPQLASRFRNDVGFSLADQNLSRSIIINQADIQGQRVGINVDLTGVPHDTIGAIPEGSSPQSSSFETIIQNSILKNYNNVQIETRRNSGSPRRTVVCDTNFDTVNIDQSALSTTPYDILRVYNFDDDRNLVSPDTVDIYKYNNSTVDFGVYSAEQAPDFIVPQTTNDATSIGSPVAGLTNEQNRAQYGIAVADKIAPCATTTTHPKVAGFTCPLDATDVSASRPTMPAFVLADEQQACRGEVQLSWESSCDDQSVADYIITRNGTDIGITPGTTFTDTGLTPGTYTYRIRARDVTAYDSLPSTHLTVSVPAQCE